MLGSERYHYQTTFCGSDPGDPSVCFVFYNLANRFGDVSFYQADIPVVPGTTYKVSIRYRVMAISGYKVLYINTNQVDRVSQVMQVSNDFVGVWRTLSVDWVAPTTATSTAPDPSLVRLEIRLVETSGLTEIQFADVFINSCEQGSLVYGGV